jgi:fatty-acyl-CoA synthase
MTEPTIGSATPTASDQREARILSVVRDLAGELGGSRAANAVSPTASLEREVGLGSLERVELLLRLERAFGRTFDEGFLALDTVADLARALVDAPTSTRARDAETAPAQPSVAGAPIAATTLLAALRHHAAADAERVHVWLPDEEDAARRALTYGRLLADAERLAGALRERGVGRGDTVGLVLPTGADFLAAFAGTLLAGAIPVPLYPPVRLDRIDEYASRQALILRNCAARVVVTFARAMPVATLLRRQVPSLRDAVTAGELSALGASLPAHEGSAEAAALIQYTSGSTGDPKGVLLTHAQLLANIRAIAAGVALRPSDVAVSWLPLYHDMGLIGAWLFALVNGVPLTLLSPLAFLARPERWLTTIHERRATLSAAPNFAYELCARKIPEAVVDGLDLSSWRAALNGAEPISPDTLDRFTARFARAGFRREAWLPVYGLAESAVALCFPPLGRGPRTDRVRREPFEGAGLAQAARDDDASALRFVSVGSALPGHEVRLLDEAGAPVADRMVGRLVFRGPSTMSGYFGKPEETAAVTLPGGLAYAAEGEIFVAGRRKDLVIKAGRNLVPQEIEEAASQVEGVRRGCVVAFGLANTVTGTESLVVVAETREADAERRRSLATAITERVAVTVGVPPDDVVLAPPHSVPKTSSGKVRRSAARELYRRGGFARPRPSLKTRAHLAVAALGHALHPLGRVLRAAYVLYLLPVAAFLILFYWLPAAVWPGKRAARTLARLGSRMLLRLIGCRLSVEGREHLAALSGPVVLASNHTSHLDIVVLLALLPRDIVFVAKREVLAWPLVGTFVRKAGHVMVNRLDIRQRLADTDRVAAALRDGEALVFFPEGTFTAATGLRPFRLGAFKAAIEARCPVVPLALSGVRAVLRGDALLPRPGPIRLWIGAPLAPPEGTSFRDIVTLRDRVVTAILAHCDEPRLDLIAGGLPASEPERP